MPTTKRAGRNSRSRTQMSARRSARSKHDLHTQPRAVALAVGAALLPWTILSPAYADVAPSTLPTGGSVAAGSASISSTGSNMQITQSSNSAILNWQSFSIGSGAWVNFSQPGSSAIALNRVLGNNPSEIFGRLTANGQVFLSNPNGVLFAPSASVEVGALFATTLSIADKDFLAGRYNFYNAGGAGSVVNQGHIVTANGYAALAGPQVRNDGIIVANAGIVALAAGDRISLDMIGDGLIRVSVEQAALNASAINSGTIQADGGTVLLTARSANALLDTVVNNSGVIRASSLIERNGEIILDGGSAGVVSNTGTLTVSGTDRGTTGGTVKVLGQYVGLFTGSTIDASGDAGGGTVLVGGNFHGAGPEQNASRTYVGANTSVNADAATSGNGGSVAVWSNDATKFYGQISARGGADSGSGGFVEVSGKNALVYAGLTDLRAPKGQAGTLLLDPNDLTIISGAASAGVNVSCTPGTCLVPGLPDFTDTATGSGAQITDGSLKAQLLLGNVTVNADGITSNTGVAVDLVTHTLTYNSTAGISLGGTYTSTGGGGTFNLNFATALDLTPVHSVSGVATVSAAGAGGASLIKAAGGATWNLTGANAGNVNDGSGVVSFSAVGNLQDTGAGTFNMHSGGADGSVSGNISAVGGSISYAGYTTPVTFELAGTANQSTGITGTWSGLTTATGSSNSDTMKGTGQTYTVTGANAGNNGTVSWTSFENITDTASGTLKATGATWTLNGSNTGTVTNLAGTFSGMANLTDLAAGTFNMHGTGDGSVTGNIVSTTPGSISYAGYTTPVTLQLSGAANQSTGITGTWSGLTTATGSSNSDTIKGANQTYTITGANAGNNGTVSWTSFENISDTGTGTLKEANATWTITGANAGTVTNLSGSFSGIGALQDTGTGTLKEANATWTITGSNAGTVTNLSGSFSGMGNLQDTASTGTLKATGATWTLNGSNTGTVTNLSGTFSGMANLTDLAAGIFHMHGTSDGSVSGTITSTTAGTVDYTGYTVAPSFDVGGGLSTGMNAWSGIGTVTGRVASDGTIRGTGATYTITGADAGSSGTVSWTKFGNISDSASGTLKEANATWTITAPNAGTVTNLSGSFSGISTLQDTGTGTLREANATWTITGANAGTVTNLSGSFSGIGTLQDTGTGTLKEANATWTITGANAGTVTNLSGSFSGMGNLQDTANTGTLRATGATWTLNGANAGSVTNLSGSFTGMKNLTDLAAGNFNMHGTSDGSITGNLVSTNPGTISYAGYTSAVTFELSGAANQSTGITGTWSGLTTATGSSNSDTIKGTNQTYMITGANAGNNGTVSWTSFENISDTGTGTLKEANATWTITGANAGTVTNLSGSFSGIGTLQNTGTGTLKEANATWTITGANTGTVTNLSGSFSGMRNLQDTANTGTLRATGATWTLNGANTGSVTNLSGSFSGMANLTDLAAGIFNMHGTSDGSITGNLVSTNPGTISYAGYTSAVTFELSGAANQSTGITGTWNGLTSATGSSNSDTIKGANQTYTITGSNAGNNGTVSWTSFENITDTGTGTLRATTATWTLNGANTGNVTNLAGVFSGVGNLTDLGAGTFNMHGTANGSVTGNLVSTSAGSISYAGNTTPVTFQLGGAANQSTGIAGTWNGLTTVVGSANSDTIKGSGQTYTLDNAIANKGTNGTVTWTSFENLSDTAAGTFNMGTGGSVSGNLTSIGGTVSYASHATPVTFSLNGAASTGMAGWSGITSVTGSAASDMITGSGQTYTVTGTNAGNNGTVSWTSIENLTDLSTGTLRATSATWTLNGSNTGSVSNLSGTFAGMGNLTDLGTGTFKMHGSGNGSISGSLSGGTNGTMNYAGYTSPVTFSLSGAGGTTTGVGGTRSGVTSVSGSGNSDTITGSGATYNLTAQNAGSSGALSWNSFENISDAAGGTFNLSVGSNNVTGTLSSGGTGATLNSAVAITALNLSVPSTLTMTGTANSWNLTGAPQPSLFQTTNPNANVTFNGACIGGPACGTVITIVGSISATVSQISSQALKDAQSTDSVAKQIDYGFAGDVGTTPPMDHRIDETGISTPECLEESREARACKY